MGKCAPTPAGERGDIEQPDLLGGNAEALLERLDELLEALQLGGVGACRSKSPTTQMVMQAASTLATPGAGSAGCCMSHRKLNWISPSTAAGAVADDEVVAAAVLSVWLTRGSVAGGRAGVMDVDGFPAAGVGGDLGVEDRPMRDARESEDIRPWRRRG